MIIIINIIYNCRSLIVTYRKSAEGGRRGGGEKKAKKKGKEMSFAVAIHEIFASAKTLFT